MDCRVALLWPLAMGAFLTAASTMPAIGQTTPVNVPKSVPKKPAAREPERTTVPSGGTSAKPKTLDDVRVEFSQQVLEVPEIGLTVPVPAECAGVRMTDPVPAGVEQQARSQETLQILPTDMGRGWSIKIRAPKVTKEGMTAEHCADEAYGLLRNRMSASGIEEGLGNPDSRLRLIERVPNERDALKRMMGGPSRQVEHELDKGRDKIQHHAEPCDRHAESVPITGSCERCVRCPPTPISTFPSFWRSS